MVLGWYQYSTSSQSGDKKPKFRPRLQGGVGRLVMEFSCFYLGLAREPGSTFWQLSIPASRSPACARRVNCLRWLESWRSTESIQRKRTLNVVRENAPEFVKQADSWQGSKYNEKTVDRLD